jgi:hypothetical protein
MLMLDVETDRMPAPTSQIGSAIRTKAVRMAVLAGLYIAIGASLLGVYGALAAMFAQTAYVAWGWLGAFAALGAYFLCTALAAWLTAHIMSRRMSAHEARPELLNDRVATAPRLDEMCDEPIAVRATEVPVSNPAHPFADMFSQFLRDANGRPRGLESWVAPVAIGIATIAVVGPVRLIRVAVRAVRIARTLQMIAKTASMARQQT